MEVKNIERPSPREGHIIPIPREEVGNTAADLGI
jgi:hypothetical protein